ncbi:MAG: DoxX protein [Nanoarchaeota archaeon]|nr:DoxX protein [Nanoarchaeota archaeon]
MGNGKLDLILRWILGLILLFFGSNSLLNFLPQPEFTGNIATFMQGLVVAGYFMPLMGLTMIFVGILLIINKWVPLGLVILAPISINIIMYHIFLDISTIAPGVIVFILNLYLGVKHIDAYRPMFR